MHRFYLPPEQCRGNSLNLSGREAHHALHVLRVSEGERVAVLDGDGHEFLCEVGEASRDTLHLDVLEKKTTAPLVCRITLLQAIPKGKLFESIVQKATELGAFRIVPILSERVISRFADEEAAQKTDKWRQVAIEAIKQCGSPWLPRVDLPQTPTQVLSRGEKFDLPLIASLEGKRHHARDYFREFQSQHARLPASVCVWVGPEGDFNPEETSSIKASGALPITLGPLVLRTETAAVCCLAILNYEIQFSTG